MILAIDQGTSGSTLLLVNEEGRIVDREYREIRQSYPQPGWVEHDPEEIAGGVLEMARALARRSDRPIRAIGITNQRETIVLWDRRTGKPVHPAIVWQDRRTAPLCELLKPEEPFFRQRTGLFLDPYFSGTKIRYLLDSDPSLRSRAEAGGLCAGTVDSWLIWKLTGGQAHATDRTNGSRTLCCNLGTGEWDPDLLGRLHIPASLLPTIHPSRHWFGECADRELGPIPLAGVAGDQQAALFGQACFRSDLVKNTYGTGCFVLRYAEDRLQIPKDPILATAAASPSGGPAFALEGSVFVAGAAVQWLRDELRLICTSAETESIARSVSDTGGVFVVPAFTGLGAPHWDAHARGAILGLTRGSSAAHIVRAVLESIAFQAADLLSLPALGGGLRELRVDGGASQNDFLMQFQADILGIPVNRPVDIETTALGAAYLAGLQAGVWASASEIEALRKTDRIFEPQMSADQREHLLQGWRSAVARVLSHETH